MNNDNAFEDDYVDDFFSGSGQSKARRDQRADESAPKQPAQGGNAYVLPGEDDEDYEEDGFDDVGEDEDVQEFKVSF